MHLALTNDEGWRLEIPGLEELTSVGSKRCFGELKMESCLICGGFIVAILTVRGFVYFSAPPL